MLFRKNSYSLWKPNVKTAEWNYYLWENILLLNIAKGFARNLRSAMKRKCKMIQLLCTFDYCLVDDHCPHDGASKHFWNNGKLLPDAVQHISSHLHIRSRYNPNSQFRALVSLMFYRFLSLTLLSTIRIFSLWTFNYFLGNLRTA